MATYTVLGSKVTVDKYRNIKSLQYYIVLRSKSQWANTDMQSLYIVCSATLNVQLSTTEIYLYTICLNKTSSTATFKITADKYDHIKCSFIWAHFLCTKMTQFYHATVNLKIVHMVYNLSSKKIYHYLTKQHSNIKRVYRPNNKKGWFLII